MNGFRPRTGRGAGAFGVAALAAALAAAPGALSGTAREAPTGTGRAGGLVDATDARGLAFVHDPGVGGEHFMPESLGSGGALFDFDGDGDLDVYLVNGAYRGAPPAAVAPPRNRLFRQLDDGTFEDATEASGLGDSGYGMGVAVGDADGDGDPDVYVSNFGPDALYRNEGDGSFREVTREAGIANPDWGASAVFFDADLDRDLDLYVANYVDFDPAAVCTDEAGRRDYCGPSGFPGVADRLFRNRGDGTFEDATRAAGVGAVASKGLGVASADFDGDGLVDLYVANDGEPNQLWIGRGDGTFEDRAAPMGAAVNELGRPEAGMGIAVGDVDGDLALDLFVTHLRAESHTLYRSGGGAFADSTLASGLAGPSLALTGFGTALFDLDHDGDLDLAVAHGRVTRGPLLVAGADREAPSYWDPYAEPNALWIGDGAGRFAAPDAAAGEFGAAIENSRGLAAGDLDNDGDVDLLVTNEGGPARLYENRCERCGSWAVVRVLGGTGGDAVGARLVARGAAGPAAGSGAPRLRAIAPGGSYLSSGDPRAHFGLGAAESFELSVRLPGDEPGTLYRALPAGRIFVVAADGRRGAKD